MEFRVLGPFEVLRDGLPLDLRGRKRRAVLALLVLRANEVVGSDRLVEELWGQHPPTNATAALYNHVSRLRKDLGGGQLVTKPWGYVLRVEPGTVDLERFERLVEDAASLPARERAATLADALALWRGPALADLADEPALSVEAARLDELRLAAIEQRVDAELELGRHAALVGELEALIAANPLRERMRGQLIVALYRAGRQAEALEVYRETRRVLVEELGIEPTPELRELEQAILRHDASLSPPAAVQPRAPRPDGGAVSARHRARRLLYAALLVPLFAAGVAAAVLTRTDGTPRDGAPAELSGVTSLVSTQVVERSTTTVAGTAKPIETKPRPHQTTRERRVTVAATSTRSRPRVTPAPPTTTRRWTTTAAVTTAPRPVASARWKWVLADPFDDAAFTTLMWHSFGSGPESVENGGRLELSIGDGVAAPFSQFYEEPCVMIDDFDAQVDFQLLDWPSEGGVGVALAAHVGGPPVDESLWTSERLGAGSGGGAETYTGLVRSDRRSVGTEDLSGTLRLVRSHGILSTYYRGKEDWVRIASGRELRFATIVLAVRASADQFGHRPVRVAFDNFRATAENVFCPGPYYPPRKLLKP